MGSHTASDRTSKSSGDIEIFNQDNLFESIEIKLDKYIDETIVRVAIEKIYIYNPERYYILSNVGIKDSSQEVIEQLVNEVKEKQWLSNNYKWFNSTLKYYLRLISNLEQFVNHYGRLVQRR